MYLTDNWRDVGRRTRPLLTRLRAALGVTALAFGMAVLPTGLTTPQARAEGFRIKLHDRSVVTKVRLTRDKSLTARVDRNVTEALVANPDIADVVPLTAQSIYIVGKKIGLTRLTLLDERKELLGIVEIEVSYDVSAIRQELQRNVPGADFQIRTANGRLIVSGTAGDALELAKVTDIVKQFAADDFLNAMSVRAPQQVMLEVRFVEAQRSAGRDLGLSWDGGANRFRGITGGVSGSPTITPTYDVNKANDFGAPTLVSPGIIGAGALLTGLPSGAVPFGTFLAQVLTKGFSADLVIQALEARGLARRLAEPNLVTLSGDTANFLAGGEFPIPVIQGTNDKITIEYKRFGVGLAFTPTVLGRGQINLKIEPEVSDLDYTNAVRLASTLVPSIVVRRAQTTVELRDGQSFAIAGLIQTRHSKNTAELPWIGQVPVLGTLFSSSSYAKQESDLVIIVTPRLVRPAVPGQRLMTPHDKVVSANDKDYFLRRKMEIERPTRPYGHILEDRGQWTTSFSSGDRHDSYK